MKPGLFPHGSEAVEQLHLAVVIMDIIMPKMNGIEVTSIINEIERLISHTGRDNMKPC